MKHIKCPDRWDQWDEWHRVPSVFVAGGITGCSDWQTALILYLLDTEVVLCNPRRDHFDVSDESMSHDQICWEHEHLDKTDATLFWFPKETLCPITLLELGVYMARSKPLFVACDPDYKRVFDVRTQLSLYRPDVEPVYSIAMLAKQVDAWAKSKKEQKHAD